MKYKKLLLFYFFYLSFLFSQPIGPVIIQEKRPTTKDPSYQPSIIPFFLKKRAVQNPAENFILNPNITIEDFIKPKQEKTLPNIITTEEEFLLKNLSDKEIRKYHFEKYFLPQVGIDKEFHQISYRYPLNEFEPPESTWERRFTIFMLSFPLTTGISYGFYRLYKSNQNLPKSLNREETIGLFVLGIFTSMYIVYYDEAINNSINSYSKALQKERLHSKEEK